MEYLRMMTKTHLKWYEYYQDRWNCLRGLVE